LMKNLRMEKKRLVRCTKALITRGDKLYEIALVIIKIK
jgi:hypothetical protein